MMFKAGDKIIHPIRGAGVVVQVEKRDWHGSSDLYYRIRLLSQDGVSVMVPVQSAKKIGLRRAISQSRIKQVWRVLGDDPEKLPTNHKKRYQLVKGKLHAGDVFLVTEVVRDMAWRQQQQGNLTTVGKRLYEEGVALLAGEIAAAQGIDLTAAEMQIKARLTEGPPPAAAVCS